MNKDVLTDLAMDLIAEVRDIRLGSDPKEIKPQILAIMSQIEAELSK